METYFQIPAVSNSFLGQVQREAMGQPPMKDNSPALRFGDAIHKLLLEPQNFDFRQYSGRERMAYMKMQQSFSQVAGNMLDGEKEVEYQYEFMGFKCKLKADIVSQTLSLVTDLKTTRWDNQGAFLASAVEYSYHRQGAWYLDAPPIKEKGIDHFRIIAICKTPPYYPAFVWEADRNDDLIEAGREEYLNILDYIRGNEKYEHLKAA